MQSNLLRLFFSSALCLGSVSAFAVGAPSEKAPFNKVEQVNEKTVGGQVLDENGEPVIGATVTVKGTKTAVVTDIDGKFSFKVPAGSTLVVTYLGYADKEVAATGTGMTINMAQDEKTLDEVVVTALGIKRSEKALSYNVQQLGNEDLTTVKSTNFMNSLAGKVAGVNINASSAGMGGATRVVMRGPKSINQSNSALYVVDGVPINNRNNGVAESIYASQPGGEGIADINSGIGLDFFQGDRMLKGLVSGGRKGTAGFGLGNDIDQFRIRNGRLFNDDGTVQMFTALGGKINATCLCRFINSGKNSSGNIEVRIAADLISAYLGGRAADYKNLSFVELCFFT